MFDKKMEVDKVLQSEPWTFDKHLVVMERYDTNSSVDELKLDRTSFWVQVHSLPIKFMNVRAAEKICEVLGRVIPTTNPRESEGGNFIQVRVSMDVTGPLCCRRLVSIAKKSRFGLASNTRDYRIYAIGVAALIMTTRILKYGRTVKDCLIKNRSNSSPQGSSVFLFQQTSHPSS